MSTDPTSSSQFPYAYHSVVEKQAKCLLDQLSDAFPLSPPPTTPTRGQQTTEIEGLRGDLAVLDRDIRDQLLRVLALKHAMVEARAAYKALEEKRRKILDRTHVLVPSRKAQELPLEVLEKICSYSCKMDPSIPPKIWFNTFYKSWGSVLYKSVPLHCTLDDLNCNGAQRLMKDGGSFNIMGHGWDEYGPGYPITAAVTALTSQEIAGMWKSLRFKIPEGHLGDMMCAAIAQCDVSLTTVKQLEITNNSQEQVYSDDIEASFRDINLPVCSRVHIPLYLAQCFHHLLPKVRHLSVSFAGTWDFTTPFRGIDLSNVQSLELVIGDKHCTQHESEPEEVFPGFLLLPNLQRLTIRMGEWVTGSTLLSIFGCIRCQQLERLDIVCGIVTDNIWMKIGSHFKSLRWLSLHLPETWEFVFSELPQLKERSPDGELVIPNLQHLSISLELDELERAMKHLVGVLQDRRGVNVCTIETIEIRIRLKSAQYLQDWHKLLIEYLGLFVKDVFISTELMVADESDG